MRSVLIAALLATPAPVAAMDAGTWKACTIESVSVCGPEGCAASKPSISIFVSNYVDRGAERGAYYRCRLRLVACDRYRALVYRNGDYTIFSLPERSVFAKLGSDDRIIDVAGPADNVVISRGRCISAAPPPDSSLRSR